LVQKTAQNIARLSSGRLRVAIDGLTAAGKTTFGNELGAAFRHLGRATLRASLDDFKNPWSEAREQGYDRVSGEGYYRNAYDFRSATELLLAPAGPDGSGQVVLCAHDPLTGVDHRNVVIDAPADAILIVDSAFAFRSEYNAFWDYRIWLDVSAPLSLSRGIERDSAIEGLEEATKLHRDRYRPAEAIYVAEVDPSAAADLVIDNSDFANPVVLRSQLS
jgi:uridine kinase